MLQAIQRPRYCSYLLRCWEEAGDPVQPWRFSLENTHTRELQGFGTLEALTAFLRAKAADRGERPDHEALGATRE